MTHSAEICSVERSVERGIWPTAESIMTDTVI